MSQGGRGYTLLEVLVVVAIASILTSLVILRPGLWMAVDGPRAALERLVGVLHTECEQALFQGRARGLRLGLDGYDFWQLDSDLWTALPAAQQRRAGRWPEGAAVGVEVGGRPLTLAADPDQRPQLICAPLDSVDAFVVRLVLADGQWQLDYNGRDHWSIEESGR